MKNLIHKSSYYLISEIGKEPIFKNVKQCHFSQFLYFRFGNYGPFYKNILTCKRFTIGTFKQIYLFYLFGINIYISIL